MPLIPPNLDDRDFQKLLADAREMIRKQCPQWTDLSPADPGMVLLEAFAFLTDVMIYRLNRLPEKAYVEFLRLMGVTLDAPAAATARLRFSLGGAQFQPVVIPRTTRVTLSRPAAGAEAPVFVTAHELRLEPGRESAEVLAYHCDLIEGELLGIGNGRPGQSFTVSRPPIIARTGDDLDLIVGVEARPEEMNERVPALKLDDKTFRIWSEIRNLADVDEDGFVYLVDRVSGAITFAPSFRRAGADGSLDLLPSTGGEIPSAGREIRVWYRRGGGPAGNVAASTLNTLKDSIPGVDVTNPAPATGGRPAETIENALFRGPLELYSLERAVTARDFEHFAERASGAIARAKAVTKAAMWKFAPPGTVEVLLVPSYLPEDQRSNGAVTAAALRGQETEEARAAIEAALNERRPLGTTCVVNWVKYKTLSVSVRVVLYRGEDGAAVRSRVFDRLHQMINPLPTPLHRSGWPFGQPLRQFDVYDMVRQEPGVKYVDDIFFTVDDVPEKDIRAIARDAFQPFTWYAAAAGVLYRTVNDGDGWEPCGRFSPDTIESVRPDPNTPGLLAVITSSSAGSRVHLSRDSGETWAVIAQLTFKTHEAAWMQRGGPVLLLATEKGLFELAIQPGASPIQVEVDSSNPGQGFYAVAAVRTVRDRTYVAVAATSSRGVFLSDAAGRSKTFTLSAFKGQEDVRVLEAQRDGPRTFLWAGAYSPGNEAGKGCFRLEIEGSAEGWRSYAKGWTGGSCRALGFDGARVVAATHHAGVVWLESNKEDPQWQTPGIRSGLPLRSGERIFTPVESVACRGEDNGNRALVVAGGPEGVYRSTDGGISYENCSTRKFTKAVTIPQTWLFCSGQHEIQVVSEDETV
jgi:hypothetical protein